MAVLSGIAQRAARRKGLGEYHLLLRRALAGISVQIQRRAAAMIRTCLPRESNEEIRQLFGDTTSDVSSDADSDFEIDGLDLEMA